MKKIIYLLNEDGEEVISTLFTDLENPWCARDEMFEMSFNIDLKNIGLRPEIKIQDA